MTANEDHNDACGKTISELLAAYVQRGETIGRSLQTINRLQDRCDTLVKVIQTAEKEREQAWERVAELEARLKRSSEAAERDMLQGITARPGPDVMTLGANRVECCHGSACRASAPQSLSFYSNGERARKDGWSCLPGRGSETRWLCPVCTAWAEEGAMV